MDSLSMLNQFYEKKLSIDDVKKSLQICNEEIEGFFIYGCGPLGNYLRDVMETLSLHLLGYIDDFYDGRSYKDMPLYSLNDIKNHFKNVVIILTPHYKDSLRAMKNTLKNTLNQDTYGLLDKNVLLYVAHGYTINTDKQYLGNIFQKSDLIISNCCTLKCKGCSVCIPYVQPAHFPLEDVKRDILKMNELVDYIAVLEVMGGEPLLYPWLAELLDHIAELPNIFQIMIDTNGTVVPDEKTLQAIARNNVLVHITDYGEVSSQKEIVLKQCKEHKIYCTIRKVGEWADFGEIQDYGADRANDRFLTCYAAAECNNIYRGRWHLCPRDPKYTDMGLFPVKAAEYIDLHDITLFDEDKRAKLYELSHRKEAISACRFCMGTTHKTLGGIQL